MMELSFKLAQYLDISKALDSYKIFIKMGDKDRKALFGAIREKYYIASDEFVDKGIERRANVIHILKNLTRRGDEELGGFFQHFLYHKDSQVFYTAILGYALCMQEKAYPQLTEIILNKNAPIAMRAYTLYELSLISGQRFITGKPPKDEREWTELDFSPDAITEWNKAGCPKGREYRDELHEKLLNPTNNPIDKLIAVIHKKYYTNEYISARDVIDGKKNIGKPSVQDVENINSKWTLPPSYKYFIENFVVKNELKREITIYSADELVERQTGFSVTPDGAVIKEWNQNLLIIADWNGDSMYCIDLSKSESSPVYQFYHDDWKLKKYAESFQDFLTKLV